jgi:hypothetical protein
MKKISLNRETLSLLNAEELERVNGGGLVAGTIANHNLTTVIGNIGTIVHEPSNTDAGTCGSCTSDCGSQWQSPALVLPA